MQTAQIHAYFTHLRQLLNLRGKHEIRKKKGENHVYQDKNT